MSLQVLSKWEVFKRDLKQVYDNLVSGDALCDVDEDTAKLMLKHKLVKPDYIHYELTEKGIKTLESNFTRIVKGRQKADALHKKIR
mgnify:CR=1 FL=1